MGACGSGPFENDDAMDWLGLELSEREDEEVLEWAFDAVIETPTDFLIETPEASTAIAAAEIVAATRGAPSDELHEVAAEWVVDNGSLVSETTVHKARAAVERVLASSELRELWDESGEGGEWRAKTEDLLRRLR